MPFVFVAAIGCLLVAAVNMFLAVRYRKPGVPLFPNEFSSPANILFMPSKLTERGLLARKRCFLGTIGFLTAMLIAFIVSAASQ